MDKQTLEALARLSDADLRDERPEASDVEQVKAAGLFLPREAQSHDQIVARVLAARDIVTKEAAVAAFLYSLGTRQLEYRSALGSFALARNFPDHQYDAHPDLWSGPCRVCGYAESGEVNAHSWINQRYRFGGGYDMPCFIAVDLEQFARLPACDPTQKDIETLANILKTATDLPVGARTSDLERALSKCVKSNKGERQTLMGILAFCNILQPDDCPGYLHGYPDFEERGDASSGRGDWGYPLSFWRGHGVVDDAVDFWFPMLKS